MIVAEDTEDDGTDGTISIELAGLPVAIPSTKTLANRSPLTAIKVRFRQLQGAVFQVVPMSPEVVALLESKHGLSLPQSREMANLSGDDKVRELQITMLMEIFPGWEGLRSYDGELIPYDRKHFTMMFWQLPGHMFSEYLVAASHTGSGLLAKLEVQNLKKLQSISTEPKEKTPIKLSKPPEITKTG